MVTQTVEAIYNNWHIELKWKINAKKAKLYIVVVNEEELESDIEPLFWSSDFIWTKLYERWRKLLSKI